MKAAVQKQACDDIAKHNDILLDVDSTLIYTNGKQKASSYIKHCSLFQANDGKILFL